ncbi:YrhK family protein [Salinibacterium sp. SWN1162]|uniref:YrhK family protein n=1 Tax=Salinibacterium sp. SWN1162 TaxID=2792053 RepID=UPI0018CE4494|nr:YrhK family protein [Salinibacterium sp. SWN1162]MBH0009022.1 YrhK family protein [Salinibacterium sp. SWN1162]
MGDTPPATSNASSASSDGSRPLVVRIGREELVIRQRYEVISIVNDILIGLLFLVGSIFFFTPELTHAGTWLFVLGSVEMLIRPAIRFSRRVHLGRYSSQSAMEPASSRDF